MSDDAIHIRNPSRKGITLCCQATQLVHTIDVKDEWPDPWAGCWTCLAQAEIITNKVPTDG